PIWVNGCDCGDCQNIPLHDLNPRAIAFNNEDITYRTYVK
ncbi:1571_t:CDS:1, partial [Acaulospora morrowiae]